MYRALCRAETRLAVTSLLIQIKSARLELAVSVAGTKRRLPYVTLPTIMSSWPFCNYCSTYALNVAKFSITLRKNATCISKYIVEL